MTTFASAEVRKVALADLNPAPYNPRDRLSPDSAEYERLRESILTYGNVQPIVVNVRDGRNTIVGGHQRFWILHEDLGHAEDVVVCVDVDEIDEKALNLALNKSAGTYDDERLGFMLDELEFQNRLSLAQWSTDEANELRNAIVAAESARATDFLIDEDIESALENKASVGGAELKEDHPHRTGEQFFQMQLVLTAEQRETVMAAINAAKEAYELATTTEAVVAISQQFLIDQGMG